MGFSTAQLARPRSAPVARAGGPAAPVAVQFGGVTYRAGRVTHPVLANGRAVFEVREEHAGHFACVVEAGTGRPVAGGLPLWAAKRVAFHAAHAVTFGDRGPAWDKAAVANILAAMGRGANLNVGHTEG